MSESAGAVSTGGSTGATSSQSAGAPSAPSAPAQQASANQATTQAPAGQSQGPTAQAQAQARKLGGADLDALVEVKVNGQVKEITVREAIKNAQLEAASQAKMREAAEIRKRAEEMLTLAKTDLDKFSQMAGIDMDQIAEERLARKYELQQMSPEQRELHEAKQRLEQYKQMDLQSKRELLNEIRDLTGETVDDELASQIPKERIMGYLQQKREESQKMQESIQAEMISGWQETGLPSDPMFGQWMAAMMLNHHKQLSAGKIEGGPLQAKDAALRVKERLNKSVRGMLEKMDAKAIHEFLGEPLVQKLRDFDIERVNRANDPLTKPDQQSPGNMPASEPKKQMNQLEWRKAMGIA